MYQRTPIDPEPNNWIDHWQSQNVHSIVITSNAAVDAIFKNLAAPQRQWLQQCRFYVASERIGAYLQQHQVSSANIHIAAGASDNAMFTCINQQGSKMSEQSVPSTVDKAAQKRLMQQPTMAKLRLKAIRLKQLIRLTILSNE